jgi:cytochrome c-type biogenesis protein CcsB
MYESLLFLAWGITGVHLAVTSRDGFSESAVPGALAAPVALGTVAAATLALPAELQRSAALVPALKSNWLMMHVSVMMLSYATLLVGSLSCVAFLIVGASQGFEPAKETLEKLDGFVGESRGNTTHAPESSAGASGVGGGDAVELDDGDAPLSLGMKINASRRNRPQVVATASSSDGVGGQLAASTSTPASATASDAAAAAPLTGDALLREMDNLAYRCLGAGFALLTAGLVSGAVWANEAWGSYWSWDPKETWALITWFTYATYLHSRLVANKDKKEVAAVGAAGFVVVWVCYVGVNLWGVGLHSYGWFANK